MPTHRQIRTAIAAKIAGAQANTQVFTFERYLSNLGALKDVYVNIAAGTLIGCHIRRVSASRVTPGVGRWIVTTKWQLRFFQALDDAGETELAFDDWLDAVAEAFRLDQTLGGLTFENRPGDDSNTEGLQIDDAGPVMFCGVLSHSAKCTLYTINLE